MDAIQLGGKVWSWIHPLSQAEFHLQSNQPAQELNELWLMILAGNIFCLQSGSWEYFALKAIGWKMAAPINVDT